MASSSEQTQGASRAEDTADSPKAAKIAQPLGAVKASVERGESSSDTAKGVPDLITAEDFMNGGTMAFAKREFSYAVQCFKRALEIQNGKYGKLAPECVEPYYKYALSLLYEFPVPTEADPMAGLPKEADYQPRLNKDGTLTAARKDGNLDHAEYDSYGVVDHGDRQRNLDSAMEQLERAWSIITKQPWDSMDKVDILSALGEVVFVKNFSLKPVQLRTAWERYVDAGDILERLVSEDSQRIAHIKFKACLCVEKFAGMGDLAVQNCRTAIEICETRLRYLTPEADTSSDTTEDTDNPNEDLSGVAMEIERNTRHLNIYMEKLNSLEKLQLDADPNSPGLSLGSLKSPGSSLWSRCSSNISTASQDHPNFESPTASTACTIETATNPRVDVAKRELPAETDGAEVTPKKKITMRLSPDEDH